MAPDYPKDTPVTRLRALCSSRRDAPNWSDIESVLDDLDWALNVHTLMPLTGELAKKCSEANNKISDLEFQLAAKSSRVATMDDALRELLHRMDVLMGDTDLDDPDDEDTVACQKGWAALGESEP